MLRVFALAAVLAFAAAADEGLWTYDRFPAALQAARHGFAPGAAWLDEARLASVKLPGCSGSFVSASGLIATNHHCVHRCLAQLSKGAQDFVRDGFLAPAPAAERRCPGFEARQLLSIEDVTERLRATGAAERSARVRLEKACVGGDSSIACETVALFHGGLYHLYRYRVARDVRLVFAPELQAAFFGGDPDNFAWPRHDLDVAFVRAYEGGRPLASPHFFRWSAEGPKDGELVFVSGHPGRTERQRSSFELETERDALLPLLLAVASDLDGRFAAIPEREAGPEVFALENLLKARRGRLARLRSSGLIDARRAEEARLPAALKPALARLEAAQLEVRKVAKANLLLESSRALRGGVLGIARALLRLAEQQGRPDERRPRSLREGALPALRERAALPLSPALEEARLAVALTELEAGLGKTDARVARVLAGSAPAALAAQLVRETRLFDAAERQRLFDGGAPAIDASQDALLVFARRLRAAGREARTATQKAQATSRAAAAELARARFAATGPQGYPDATGTLRLSVGEVLPLPGERARTSFAEAFAKATGVPPYQLPASWLAARAELPPDAPLCFVSTADITAGSSGSPVLDRAQRLVGLIFDGNAGSLGDDFAYDAQASRAIAVDSRAVLIALERIYRAGRLLAELGATNRQ